MNRDDNSRDVSGDLAEKLGYLREVEEELARRELRLAALIQDKEEIEIALKRVSVKGAFISGDVAKLRMSEFYRKNLKLELKRKLTLIAGAQEEIKNALERKELVEAEIADFETDTERE